MSSIPTRYRGVQFRSLLEARWAAFFDIAHWNWEFEPISLDYYIPDFVLRFPRARIVVEVKPAMTAVELHALSPKTTGAGWPGEVLMLGATLFSPPTEPVPSIGLYAQLEEQGPIGEVLRGPFDHALLHRCRACGEMSFHHVSGSWRCAVRGCHDGKSFIDLVETDELRRMWGEAGARTQWMPDPDHIAR